MRQTEASMCRRWARCMLFLSFFLASGSIAWRAFQEAHSQAALQDSATELVFLEPNLSLIQNPNDSFSGCLLVMDENFRLAEWLAYHYHVLPLRYLVVATDPRSRASPDPILETFRQTLPDFTIVSWKDADYGDWEPLPENATNLVERRERHRVRQRTFLQKCMQHLAEKKRSWTILWDTDEYFVYTGYEQSRMNLDKPNKQATAPGDLVKPGSVMNYVKDFGYDRCIGLNRVNVGSNDTDQSILDRERHVVDPLKLDTLRYRYRYDFDRKLNGRGKCILDVRYVNHSHIPKSPHQPAPYLCSLDKVYARTNHTPFYLLHFMSSWEAYTFRDDGRKGRERTRQGWLERAYASSKHYEIATTTWLTGFVRHVGVARARRLLQSSGLPSGYNASDKIQEYMCSYGPNCKQEPLKKKFQSTKGRTGNKRKARKKIT